MSLIPEGLECSTLSLVTILSIQGVEKIFEKESKTEKGGIDFEIVDLGTFTHLHCWLKKISCFWWQKKIAFKSSIDLYLHPFIIEFFWFA